eukprot:scaffold82365_cov26-Tisochrysis_lutea.AAC.2
MHRHAASSYARCKPAPAATEAPSPAGTFISISRSSGPMIRFCQKEQKDDISRDGTCFLNPSCVSTHARKATKDIYESISLAFIMNTPFNCPIMVGASTEVDGCILGQA